MKKFSLLILFTLVVSQLLAQQKHTVKKLKITILSTMLSQRGIGEWGFSALVEADSIKILFDAGGREKTVLENCKEMNIDLSKVPSLILSHNHADHTVGWLPLRNAVMSGNPQALSMTHVGKGLFDTRITATGDENNNRQKDSQRSIQAFLLQVLCRENILKRIIHLEAELCEKKMQQVISLMTLYLKTCRL
jgi:metal-dependent hydrolase (beta-lactamase superfamily II)